MPHIPWWTVPARIRVVFGRRPWLFWSVVLLAGLVVAVRVQSAEHAAATARRAWGSTRQVWVAEADTHPGEPLAAQARAYPAAMVPAGALASPPAGRAAREVLSGEVLTALDVADDATPPADWVVLALPADRAPSLAAGDRAVLFGGGSRRCEGITVEATDVVEVAVPPDCAAAVTTDLTAGDVAVGRAMGG